MIVMMRIHLRGSRGLSTRNLGPEELERRNQEAERGTNQKSGPERNS